MSDKKTAIVTGAQQGIGAGLVEGFANAGYNVEGTSLHATVSLTASPTLITKGGLNTMTRQLAIEYAKEGIRFNAVAPGAVDAATHLKTLQPMGKIATVKDLVDAVLYLAQADQVTGEVLHVDGGADAGRW